VRVEFLFVLTRNGGIFFFFFEQSQGLGWERGSGGVAVDPGISGQEGCTRDISISRQGWWLREAVHMPTGVTCVTQKHSFLVNGTLTHLALCIIRGEAGKGRDEGQYGPGRG